MVSVCFYFQVHQPIRLRKYSVFDIGNNSDYFDEHKNQEIIKKVSRKCYLPTNKLLLKLISQHKGKFKVSFCISGVALEQFEKYAPEIIHSFRELAKTGCVEFINETYYHSLSFLFDKDEFKEQVMLHKQKIKDLFGQESKVFRNTELIYSNELANFVQDLGYNTILAEGADHILGWRSPNFVYTPKTAEKMKLLLKNYKLSDDIAFRFSNKGWKEYPLTVEKYAKWISAANGNGFVVNLFMDYETFGEHQWEDTGIFEFIRHLPEEVMKRNIGFKTPSETIKAYKPVGKVDIPHLMSWADMERDLSAWRSNELQESALQRVFDIEHKLKINADHVNDDVMHNWRKLQTSDHFYYMCTKYWNDGDVHAYFSPFESPYDAFITYMNTLSDFEQKVEELIATSLKDTAYGVIEQLRVRFQNISKTRLQPNP
nr:glycoside hydrolase family 57 protein [Nanoarchaeota archaeon]